MTKRRWLLYFVPTVTLLLFIAVLGGGSILKLPMGQDDRLLESIQRLEVNVNQENWVRAEEDIEYASAAWKKVVNRIQYSVEREYIFEINNTLARIKGGVKAKDDKAIMEEIYFFYELWSDLGE